MLLQQELELTTIETNRNESLARSLTEELRSLQEEVKVAEQIYQGGPPCHTLFLNYDNLP